ncbi:MAG: Gldg family protein [Verrucomicrobiota bacterium]|jgi:ABC-type uncharacterized transport system involved in gliding motility auxiliary subunit
MKQSKSQALLFSTLGVAIAFAIVVLLNFVFSRANVRLDLTEDGLHSLSPGTRQILSRVGQGDTPVTVNFYASLKGNRLPPMEEAYARQVEDLLSQFASAANGLLVVKKFDPQPDSEEEDAAKIDGVEPQMNQQNGEPYYLGLSVNLDPQKAALPALSVQRDRLLEYDLARAIAQVLQTNKPVIGIMTPLPAFGTPMNPMMMRMGQQGSEPWVFIGELKRDFDVRQVNMDVDSIDPAIKVLLVIHPKDISDKAQFALDQFVLRGGRLVAMLDGLCLADNRNPNPMGFNMGGGSSLPKLLKQWGIEFDTTKVAADARFSREIDFGRGSQPAPSFLFLNRDAVSQADVVFGQTDNILLPFSGVFTGKAADGLKQDVLLHTSKDSQLVDGVTSQLNGRKVLDDFSPSGVEYALAIRLTGKFKTAFPDGKPAATKPDDQEKKDEPKADVLKESKEDGIVYLLGDSDFLYDPYCVRVDRMFRVAVPFNGNLSLGQNLVEQVAGDSSLIGARSRATVRRPFTVIQEKQAEAAKKFQAEIARFQKEVDEAGSKISQIQSRKEGNQKFILSPEAKAEYDNLVKKQADANRQLRKVRKDLRQEVEALEFNTKLLNIAGMALVVTGVGIALAVIRMRKTAAR